jgi:hypothetical protein
MWWSPLVGDQTNVDPPPWFLGADRDAAVRMQAASNHFVNCAICTAHIQMLKEMEKLL